MPKEVHGKALYHEGHAIPFAALIVSTTVAMSVWMGWISEDFLLIVLFPDAWCEFHPALTAVMALGAMMVSKRLRLTIDGGYSIPAMTMRLLASCWTFSPAELARRL